MDIEAANSIFANVGTSGFESTRNNLAVEAGLSIEGSFVNVDAGAGHHADGKEEQPTPAPPAIHLLH